MHLVPDLSNRILSEVKTLTNENIIIVDQKGVIIASTDQSRVGTTHDGAKAVMNTGKKLYITQQMTNTLKGVKPGINLPITFENKVIGVIGITGTPTDVEPFADLIRGITELIIKEANYIEKKEWETRVFESFFYEWIYTDGVDHDLINRGKILGIPFDIPYQCFLIQLDPVLINKDLIHIQNNMKYWFEKEFPKGRNDYLIRWGDGRFLFIKSDDDKISASKLSFELSKWKERFQNQYELSMSIGVGKTIEEGQLSTSYYESKKALHVALKSSSIVFYDSLVLDIVLDEIQQTTKTEFMNKVFSSINQKEELLETLRVYLLNNQSLKKTADELHIHINTLHYRLNQIKDLTKIDPKNTKGIAVFYIALHLMDQ